MLHRKLTTASFFHSLHKSKNVSPLTACLYSSLLSSLSFTSPMKSNQNKLHRPAAANNSYIMFLLLRRVWEKLHLRWPDYTGQFYKKSIIQCQLCNQRIKRRTKDNGTKGEARRQGGATACSRLRVRFIEFSQTLHFTALTTTTQSLLLVYLRDSYILQIIARQTVRGRKTTYFHCCPQFTDL